MRQSQQLMPTIKENPADAEVASHRLMLRAGLIRQVASGLYTWLPLGLRVIRKVEAIVREELTASGAQEVLMPVVQPAELWQETGRWSKMGPEMLRIQDRHQRDFCLGPTHEEVITDLFRREVHSYRQLPCNFFQIQTKFRDEIRPRFGLMRAREFIMKDAYSFHASEESLQGTYAAMDEAYRRIFSRCGLDAVPVDADSGAIGGAASQEFMVTADAGEDLILISDDGLYAANQEKAISCPHKPIPLETGESATLKTPGQGSIESLCETQGWHPSQVVKVLMLLARMEDESEKPLLVALRGDQDLNQVKLVNALSRLLDQGVLDCRPITVEETARQGLDPLPLGAIGPDLDDAVLKGASSWAPSFIRLADTTATELDRFHCGGNSHELHRCHCDWETLGGRPEGQDLRNARAGEACVHNPKARLQDKRGIEVGHIFQLGRKYSEAMDSRFTNENGRDEAFWMGCYGIGISRLAQAAVEQHHDEAGICWPTAIAPFEAIVVVANIQDEAQLALGEATYSTLLEAGIDVLLDDRKERAGVKFKDADLIGIPWRIVIGRDAAEGNVELIQRSNREMSKLPHAEATSSLLRALRP